MWDADPKKNEQPQNKSGDGMKIVGINLLILVIYLIALKFVEGGAIFDALLIAAQLFVCIILAIALRSRYWMLSGILVLVIGFSTCVTLGGAIG